jgi:glycosyltransferase involved in cell wall biosynthesis/multidrug transporter EmrE-like cation transporter
MRDGIGVYARDDVQRRRAAGERVTVLSPPGGAGDIRVPFRGGRAFLRAARLGRDVDRIVLHFQPSLYFAPRRPLSKVMTALALSLLTVARGRRLEIVVHEADPPMLWRPDYLLLRNVFHLADRCTFHTREEWEGLEREYHVRVQGALVEHRVDPAASVGRDEARAALGIPAEGVLFVCVGFVQPSKGYDRALEAFARAAIPDGRLAIVGSVRDGTATNRAYARALAERAQQVDGATFVEAFLSDEDVDRWIAAADRVVVPYRRAWSSGVLARAHAIGTPAIVARTGGLAEQAGAKDVIVDDDEGLVAAMRDAAGSPPPVRGGAGAPVPSPHAHPHDPRQEWNPELRAPDEGKGRGVLIGLILISVVLAAVAQLTLKHGMNQVTDQGAVPLQLGKPLDMLRRVAVNPSVVGGLAIFVLSAVFWLVVLSRVSLSFAYPFVSLTYVLILVFDRFVLDQPVSPLRYAGVALILAGLVLISRTHSTA